MSLTEIAARLRDLHAVESPAVARFDDGVALHGRVAVLPSAFNPPTVAHLHLLDLGRAAAGADQSVALLTTRNVSKGVYGASLEHRVGMLLALHLARPELAVMAANVARIADQAEALRAAHPAVEFDFVMGHDTVVRLFERQFYTDMEAQLAAFFAGHRVVATNRGEADLAAVHAVLDLPEAAPYRDRIIVAALDPEPAAMSSTLARNAVAEGVEPASLPAAVLAYIRAHGLYAAA